MRQVLDSTDLVNGFTLEPYLSPNFMGLFVSEENAIVLKHIALQYVKEVSNASMIETHFSLKITVLFMM